MEWAIFFEDHVARRYWLLMRVDVVSDRIRVEKAQKHIGSDTYIKVINLSDVVIQATPLTIYPEYFENAKLKEEHMYMDNLLVNDRYRVQIILKSGELAFDKLVKVLVVL